ncbi:pentapeptide repeat-containing protein, partial [Acinetobacter baumannii]
LFNEVQLAQVKLIIDKPALSETFDEPAPKSSATKIRFAPGDSEKKNNDYSRKELVDSDFRGQNLAGGSFAGANLVRVNFSGAGLQNV